jgi:hypothetical protein
LDAHKQEIYSDRENLPENEIKSFNPLKTELNPICRLMALLGPHPILHICRIRVNNRNCNQTNTREDYVKNRETFSVLLSRNHSTCGPPAGIK